MVSALIYLTGIWLRRYSGSFNDQRVGGSNPIPSSFVDVFLGKMIHPKMLLMELTVPCMASATHWCENRWMTGHCKVLWGSVKVLEKCYIRAVHLQYNLPLTCDLTQKRDFHSHCKHLQLGFRFESQ